MAEVHNTTMAPTKIELLTAWIPKQSWYLGGGAPSLGRAGGFRLDDPTGEVGIELMIVSDVGDGEAVYYVVPLTYRGATRDETGDGLIGTSEHGVLGTRWIYDGTTDPVLLAELAALLRGEVQAQAQHVSNELDTTSAVTHGSGATPRVIRVLEPSVDGGVGSVSASWKSPDGTVLRGVLATFAK